MTPKEKSIKLIEAYWDKIINDDDGDRYDSAKQCALIAVDEILNSEPRYPNDVDWDDVGGTHQYYYEAQFEEAVNYWQEVKQEIKNL